MDYVCFHPPLFNGATSENLEIADVHSAAIAVRHDINQAAFIHMNICHGFS